jgi:hypothetical protein
VHRYIVGVSRRVGDRYLVPLHCGREAVATIWDMQGRVFIGAEWDCWYCARLAGEPEDDPPF